MNEFENLFDLLWQDRQEHAISEALADDQGYQEAAKQAGESLKNRLKQESFEILDDISSAHALAAAEYGRVAYRQGLRDGIQLMRDIMNG